MDDSIQVVLRKVVAIGCAAMLVGTLSAIAVVRADQRTGVAAGSNAALGSDDSSGGDIGAIEDGATGELTEGAGAAVNGTTGGGSSGASTGGGGATAAAGGATGGGATGGRRSTGGSNPNVPYPNTSTNCPDYNPNVGVFCDHFLVGGTTVLSGPLAVYGDQGLKGGLSWINYFNKEIAPKERLRRAQLKWYNDDLDPNKTLLYVQRLNEVDHVLYLGGVTSPEAISTYLEKAKFPMIGDIGLSPKSYNNRYIFPTAPSEQTRNPLRIKMAKERLGITSFAVIQDVLPGVDPAPLRAAWENAARDSHVTLKDYVEVPSTNSSCSAQFSRIAKTQADYFIFPTATGMLLACMREAVSAGIKPGNKGVSEWLKGWSGGSNLQLEVDNCKPWCEGMYSIGTPFNDPRTATSPQMVAYRQNMSRYAPNVDMTGFIAINYYHAGYVFYSMVKAKGITDNLTRDSLVNAAESFGPFDTGFGNSITWNKTIPRVPWTCGYPVQVQGDRWVFDTNKVCL